MNKQDTQIFKKKLEEELKTLEGDLAGTGRKNSEHPGDWEPTPDEMDILAADENEVADKLESFQENQAIQGEFEGRYHQVKRALERIEKGTYGICKICKKVIEKERLNANAAANTCIEHKDK